MTPLLFIAGEASVKLRMELNTDQTISEQQAEEAIKFGVEFESTFPISAKRYIVAFFRKLLLQSQKLKQGFLAESLNQNIREQWQNLLSFLENNSRKVLDIQSGSITFHIFCPTQHSSEQLQNEIWLLDLKQKIENFLEYLGRCINI